MDHVLNIMSRVDGAAQHLTIQGDLTIYNAIEMKQRLQNAQGNCRELHLDLSQIAEIDTAGFQVLVALRRQADKDGKRLLLSKTSGVVGGLLDLYGMTSYFAPKSKKAPGGGQAQERS